MSMDSHDVVLSVTKQKALKLHQESLERDGNNDNKSEDLLQAIGGIDAVLDHYLSRENNILNEAQINQIYQILSKPSKYNEPNNVNTTSNIQIPTKCKKNDSLNPETTIYLQCEYTFLHLLFPYVMAENVIKFIYHKI
eukprot:493631_1